MRRREVTDAWSWYDGSEIWNGLVDGPCMLWCAWNSNQGQQHGEVLEQPRWAEIMFQWDHAFLHQWWSWYWPQLLLCHYCHNPQLLALHAHFIGLFLPGSSSYSCLLWGCCSNSSFVSFSSNHLLNNYISIFTTTLFCIYGVNSPSSSNFIRIIMLAYIPWLLE